MATTRRRGARTILIFLAVVCLCTCVVQGQNNCVEQERCDACIQTPGCMWCSKPKRTSDDEEIVPHCKPTMVDPSSFCEAEHLENPKNHQKVIDNDPLTTVKEDMTSLPQGAKIVQLAPQRMKLKLRKGTPETIAVTYRQAQDYPVDLYYLMDLSNSMSDDKDQLAELGGLLTDTLRNLTSKFTIGFGSFVDKVMMPYTETSPDKIEDPGDNITSPYAFINNLPLGNDSEMFTQRVKEANISGNLDDPEGGFDALMQVMVCKNEIGWRNQSRRIIVFSTDDKFHYAGDGRLAGVVTPNDEQCHLNEDNEYDAFDQYDYPSIAQINKVAKEENINIIFAVSKFEDLYRDVSSLIETSSYGLLNNDSSNVVELVVNQYKQISSKVRLTDNSTNSPVSIRYTSSCLTKGGQPLPTQECLGISQGSEVIFNLEIVAKECRKDQDNLYIEVKTLQDSLLLEIEFDCKCQCETQNRNDNSSDCTHKGDLVCGVCECFTGYQGKNCMCSISDASDGRPEDEQLCKAPGEDRVCSGQGYCSCGACACRGEEITGKYCQCNSRKCLSGVEEQCSGNGFCDCDKCSCNSGFTGHFCECRTKEVCINPKSENRELECSGHGVCDCGKCRCNQTYSGRYCEDCLTCKTGKCLEFRDRVQCLFNTPSCQNNLSTIPVDTIKPYTDKGAQECTFDDETDGCHFKFSYLYRDHDMAYDIHVLKNKECPQQAPFMGIVFGLVAAIVAIGLLTLIIWKLVTTIHDRKEYARFENERKQGTWSNDNVLYRDPNQTVQNPVFAQNS